MARSGTPDVRRTSGGGHLPDRINLHRKIVKHAAFTGQYPIAVLSDCVVYAADGPSPLDFLPYRDASRCPRVQARHQPRPGQARRHPERALGRGSAGAVRRSAAELRPFIKDGNVTDADNGE
ncbi:hypothetical protein Smic_84900 [Streptomyces microflavus]|uniref:Uncharacterized protein n=1 Tax=Streptomyces microflavus TaxID=1919 RepID=A0A7J0D6X2_STRMI|nr:hypothetical protein Smic_84900 [Streptomyces microflavus]